MVGGVNPKKAG